MFIKNNEKTRKKSVLQTYYKREKMRKKRITDVIQKPKFKKC